MALVSPGPRVVAMDMASTILGMAIIMSQKRMIRVSASPPKKPAKAPRRQPTRALPASEIKAIFKEVRVPYTTRLKMSRPKLSVPKICAGHGVWKVAE